MWRRVPEQAMAVLKVRFDRAVTRLDCWGSSRSRAEAIPAAPCEPYRSLPALLPRIPRKHTAASPRAIPVSARNTGSRFRKAS